MTFISLIALAALFAYLDWRRSAVDIGNGVGRLLCMTVAVKPIPLGGQPRLWAMRDYGLWEVIFGAKRWFSGPKNYGVWEVWLYFISSIIPELTLFHLVMGYNSAYFPSVSFWQVSRRFHFSVECISCTNLNFRNPSVAHYLVMQCGINETVILETARLMKSHGFFVNISSDKVRHTVIIRSFRIWVIITSVLTIAIRRRSEIYLGI